MKDRQSLCKYQRYLPSLMFAMSHPLEPHTGITLYRTIRFKEQIQCIGPSEFTGPRESVNVIPNWEECITGNYWAYYTHRVALGDAADDAGTKLLPRKCRISIVFKSSVTLTEK